MAKIKINKASVDRIESRPHGQAIYWDNSLTGFGLVVGKTSKTYVVQKDVLVDGKRKSRRITIGRHGVYTPEKARDEAKYILLGLDCGGTVEKIRRAKRGGDAPENTSLGTVFDEYIAVKQLKKRTKSNYRRCFEAHFNRWRNKPMSSITRDQVVTKHARIGRESPSTANFSMRMLNAVFNYAIAKYEDADDETIAISTNPVSRLTLSRLWYPEKRRESFIKPHQLPDWLSGVNSLTTRCRHDGARDFFIFLLFTGLRKNEARALTWDLVDINHKTIRIVDTKNKKPLTLPLSDYLLGMLKRRQQSSVSRFVFPNTSGKNWLSNPRRYAQMVVETSGVQFIPHDLRRTFITVAVNIGISPYTIKRLVNHADGGDITASYFVSDVEQLRAPMQQITDRLLLLCGIRSGDGKVVAFRA